MKVEIISRSGSLKKTSYEEEPIPTTNVDNNLWPQAETQAKLENSRKFRYLAFRNF